MNERDGFRPKFRPGEVIPDVPKGKSLTRVHGELVFVSAKEPEEEYFGNSPYTERQLGEIIVFADKALQKGAEKNQVTEPLW